MIMKTDDFFGVAHLLLMSYLNSSVMSPLDQFNSSHYLPVILAFLNTIARASCKCKSNHAFPGLNPLEVLYLRTEAKILGWSQKSYDMVPASLLHLILNMMI